MSDTLITISKQQLDDVLTAVLIDGNPFSTIQWEFSSGFNDINESNREDFCGEVFSQLKTVAATSERDHCTPEERAVIDASIKYREAVRAKARYSPHDDETGERWQRILSVKGAAEIAWDNAVDRMLATIQDGKCPE